MPPVLQVPSETSIPNPVPLTAVEEYIDWRMFLLFWGFKGETLPQLLVNPEARRTLDEGKQYLRQAISHDSLKLQALLRFEQATRRSNDIVLADGTVLPMLRSQSPSGHYLCLSDFFHEQQPAPLVLFTVVAQPVKPIDSETERLMSHAVCARLAEAGAEWLQATQMNPLFPHVPTLRLAFGYATCPDHSLKRIVFDRLQAERQLDITLTDHYSIQPSTSVCGFFVCHPDARYFPVGRVDREQLADYCKRRGISLAEGEQLLSKYITT